MKVKSLLFTIFIFCTGYFSVFAQPLNQKAQLLTEKSTEYSGNIEFRAKVGTLLNTRESNPEYLKSKALAEISPYFQFRVGASSWLEYQFRIGHRFNFLIDIYHFEDINNAFVLDFNHELYFENYLKFGLLNTAKASIALLPQLGIYAGCEGNQRDCVAPGYFGVSTGGIIMFDAVVSKDMPDNRFYWGIPLRFRYNIFDITEFTFENGKFKLSEAGLGTIRRSFPYGELGLSFGRQFLQNGLITRHEVFIMWNFCNYVQFQGPVGKNIMSATWENIYSEHLFTLGYNVSFGYEAIY